MPFVDFAGPVAAAPGTRDALLDAAKAFARERGAMHLEVRSPEPLPPDWPALTHKQSYVVDLSPRAVGLWEAFSRKHRKNIRRAEKNGLTVHIGAGELVGEFYRVLRVGWHSLGSPLYSQRFFERLIEHFPGRTKIFVVRHGGRAVAVALNGLFNGRVEGLWAAMLPLGRDLDANYVLYWEMIKHFADEGHAFFSLGRSSAGSTAEAFKTRWNAVPQQLHWGFWPPTVVPKVAALDPKYRLAVTVWKRLPQAVTARLGPRLAPNFP